MLHRWIGLEILIYFLVVSTKTTRTIDPIALPPSNTAGLVVYNYTLDASYCQYPKGYIQCNHAKKYFWESTVEREPNSLYSRSLLAQFMGSWGHDVCENFCFCTTNGTCYTRTGTKIFTFYLMSYCDRHGCFIYSKSLADGEFVSTDGQVLPAFSHEDVGYNSPYVKVTSIGCGSCDVLRALECSGSYMEMKVDDANSCSINETFTFFYLGFEKTCEALKIDNSGGEIDQYVFKRSVDDHGRGSGEESHRLDELASGSGSGSDDYSDDDTDYNDSYNPWPMEKCNCKEGYLRRSNGRCVEPIDC